MRLCNVLPHCHQKIREGTKQITEKRSVEQTRNRSLTTNIQVTCLQQVDACCLFFTFYLLIFYVSLLAVYCWEFQVTRSHEDCAKHQTTITTHSGGHEQLVVGVLVWRGTVLLESKTGSDHLSRMLCQVRKQHKP